MPKLFYLSEIIKFAIEKEEESFALYRNLAEIVTAKEVKELFQRLMREEKEHKEFYTSLLKNIEEKQSPGVEEDEEYNAYMRELISESRSVSPPDFSKISSVLTAIDYAIAREKDSILFYVGLRTYIPKPNREQIEVIITEEGHHMALLSELRKKL